jgi:tRNA-2-methylthio-N6-dimethylallyladenosine synthase
VIVGFPGESDADFRETLSLLREVEFDWGFVFKYSARTGTPAAELEGWPEELIEERHQECLALLENIAATRRSRFLDTVQEVLVEEEGFGRTRGNCKVGIQGDARIGDLQRVKITRAERSTLVGMPVPRLAVDC